MKKERKTLIRNTALLILFEPLFATTIVAISGITPKATLPYGWYNLTSVFIAAGVNLIFWLLLSTMLIGRLISKKKVWVLEYISVSLLLPAFLGTINMNLILPSLPDWKWCLPLLLMYPLVAILPFVNQGLSSFLHKEILAPRTQFGRVLLWALPAMGITGATLSQIARGYANGLIGYAIIGLLFHLLLVWQTASFSQQIWKQWQKEKLEGQNGTNS